MIIRRIAFAVTLSVFVLGALAAPALADGHGHHRGWNKHGRAWDGGDPRIVYAPGYLYAPPRVVYAPPPRVVYAPVYAAPPVVYEPAAPSLNFIFPLR